ncbi:MAG: hypothetical protein JSW12_02290 [Deltaproteobacteria bacterium]|nr:MAG: hypothetical protein JSW12_02290 [Deltaproteobacteria bacterium]
MKKYLYYCLLLMLGAAITLATPATSKSQPSAADFYKGKVFVIIVGHSPGGGYDTWARMIAPYMGRELGCTVIVKNVVGAAAKVAVTQMRDQSDGLTIGTMNIMTGFLQQVYTPEKVKFDLGQYNWLGILTRTYQAFVVSPKLGIKTVDDLKKLDEITAGVDRPESGMAMRIRILSMLLNKPIKLVLGYRGSSEINLAVMRQEVTGGVPGISTALALVESGDLVPIVTTETTRLPAIPNIPTVYELRSLAPEEKELMDLAFGLDPGRYVLAPPAIPKQRLDFLKEAFRKVCLDPGLQEKATKFGEPISYQPGEVMEKLIKNVLSMSPQTKAKLADIVGFTYK